MSLNERFTMIALQRPKVQIKRNFVAKVKKPAQRQQQTLRHSWNNRNQRIDANEFKSERNRRVARAARDTINSRNSGVAFVKRGTRVQPRFEGNRVRKQPIDRESRNLRGKNGERIQSRLGTRGEATSSKSFKAHFRGGAASNKSRKEKQRPQQRRVVRDGRVTKKMKTKINKKHFDVKQQTAKATKAGKMAKAAAATTTSVGNKAKQSVRKNARSLKKSPKHKNSPKHKKQPAANKDDLDKELDQYWSDVTKMGKEEISDTARNAEAKSPQSIHLKRSPGNHQRQNDLTQEPTSTTTNCRETEDSAKKFRGGERIKFDI